MASENSGAVLIITGILTFLGGAVAAYFNLRGAITGKRIDANASMSEKMWDSLSDREKWLWSQFQNQFDQLAKKNDQLEAEAVRKDQVISEQNEKIATLEMRVNFLEERLRKYEGDGK